MVTELEEAVMSIVLRHEALLFRTAVEDRRRSAVVAVGEAGGSLIRELRNLSRFLRQDLFSWSVVRPG
jgi:DNA-binding MarR family transcriptional regulator